MARYYVSEEEFEYFRVWLESRKDTEIEPCKGEYELLRWKQLDENTPKPIVFRNDRGRGVVTFNNAAVWWFERYKLDLKCSS